MSTKKFSKKEILDLLTDIVKENRSGSKLYFSDRDGAKLCGMLATLDKYKNSIKNSNHFKIRYRVSHGKRYKVCEIVLHGGKTIPVTKTSIKEIGKKFNKRAAVLAVLRKHAEDDIINFKRSELRKPHYVNMNEKIHIDHEIPFIKLACDWVESENWKSFDDVKGRKWRNTWILDLATEYSWREYHSKKAKLKVVSAEVNLRESSKGYSAPF